MVDDERVKEVLELQQQGISVLEIADKYYNGSDKSKRDGLRKYMKSRGYKLIKQKFVYQVLENQIKIEANKDEGVKETVKREKNNMEILTPGEVDQLKEIINMKDELKEVIQKYNNVMQMQKQNKSTSNNLDIDLSLFDAEVKNRVVKVYNNVNEDWKALSDQYRQYKQQDLISLALYEFIQKHKK